MKNKYLLSILMILCAGRAWAMEHSEFAKFLHEFSTAIYHFDLIPVGLESSTATCPSVENGEWLARDIYYETKSQEFEYKHTTWTCDSSYWYFVAPESGTPISVYNGGNWALWLRVPHKIERKVLPTGEAWKR